MDPLTIADDDCRIELFVTLDVRPDRIAGDGLSPGQISADAVPSTDQQASPRDDDRRAVEVARRLLMLAAKRAFLFDEGSSREPSWNILLDLLVQHSQSRPVSVSSACIASLAPPTTALRHIHALIESGKVNRVPDPADQRRAYLCLSPETRANLVSLLLTIPV